MSKRKNSLPARIRHQTGLSPAQRAQLDADAKAVAMKFTWAAKSRNAPLIAAITAPMTKEGVIALALNLAEAISPGDTRLLEVTRVPGDGLPLGVARSHAPRPSAPPATVARPARSQARTEALSAPEGDEDAAA